MVMVSRGGKVRSDGLYKQSSRCLALVVSWHLNTGMRTVSGWELHFRWGMERRVTHVRSQRGKVRTDGLYKQSAVLHWCSQESDGTYKTRRLRAGPGVAGSVAESRASGGRLRSRSGGPEAKLGRWKTLDLSATLINSWPSSVEGFFPCLAYAWGGSTLGAPRLSYP